MFKSFYWSFVKIEIIQILNNKRPNISMLSFLLISASFCFGEYAGRVVPLTMENWDSLVEKRDLDTVWLVMFTSETCPACKVTYPIFQKAAIEADGLVNFGLVRADLDEGLRLRYNIQYLPTFVIIHKKGKADYTGKRTERSFVNTAAKFIPDKTMHVEKSWLTDNSDSIILFTEKDKTPPIWSAISCVFQGKIRVGITDDDEIAQSYKIDKRPAILFVNKTDQIVYHGKNSFLTLKQSVDDFMAKEYEEPFQYNVEFFLPEEYESECAQTSGYCIIHVNPDLDPKMSAAYQKFKNNRLKFFYGDEDLPFDFMKKGDLFIFHPNSYAALKVGSPSELSIAISSIFDGSAQWKSIDHFKNEN